MTHWTQDRPTKPGRYEVRPWLEAQPRPADLVQKPSGLFMVKLGNKEVFHSVNAMSATLWWRGPMEGDEQ